ncbi:MAG: VOC family protein [Pseudomonadota bacterium]|nr:VOC family protein [Pseudomonadota bacterium]
MTTALDHLVVAAATLEQGVAWCEATLGVTPGPGGRHALFGTHNRLLKIATAAWPAVYLEIIAIDPEAPPPTRPRWFGLDNSALQAQLAASPRLVHAVVRSTMLDMHRWGLITVGCRPGEPVSASRETTQGLLSWQILVPEDGRPDAGGALPTLIQWAGEHPTAQMPDSGVTLQSLSLRGVPERASAVLRLRGVDFAADAGPSLRARLATPLGDLVLEAAGTART